MYENMTYYFQTMSNYAIHKMFQNVIKCKTFYYESIKAKQITILSSVIKGGGQKTYKCKS